MPKGREVPEVLEMAAEIRTEFDGAYVLNLEQVKRVIGVKSRNSAVAWVSSLVPRYRNRQKVWLVADVAHKLYNGKEAAVG